MSKKTTKQQQGYTLLEYCAGAAIIGTIVYAALNALGTDLQGFLQQLGAWAGRRGAELSAQ
jgi:hypothetical protein